MFERILVAVDGSDCARRAAKYGLELASRYDATVETIAVYRNEEWGRSNARDALDEVVELAADRDVTLDTEALSGNPAATIVRRTADGDADLVAVGRRGRSGVKAHLLGSVTERVIRRTDVPVLTVPDGVIDADTGATYESVLVTTDGSDVAERAAPYGADLARQFAAALHVLNAVDLQAAAGVFDAGGVNEAYVERLESRGQEAIESLLDGIDASTLDVHRAVVRGTPHEVIGEYVTAHDVDVVAISSEGQSNLAGQQLGTVAGRVLRTVGVPVLVVTAS